MSFVSDSTAVITSGRNGDGLLSDFQRLDVTAQSDGSVELRHVNVCARKHLLELALQRLHVERDIHLDDLRAVAFVPND